NSRQQALRQNDAQPQGDWSRYQSPIESRAVDVDRENGRTESAIRGTASSTTDRVRRGGGGGPGTDRGAKQGEGGERWSDDARASGATVARGEPPPVQGAAQLS